MHANADITKVSFCRLNLRLLAPAQFGDGEVGDCKSLDDDNNAVRWERRPTAWLATTAPSVASTREAASSRA